LRPVPHGAPQTELISARGVGRISASSLIPPGISLLLCPERFMTASDFFDARSNSLLLQSRFPDQFYRDASHCCWPQGWCTRVVDLCQQIERLCLNGCWRRIAQADIDRAQGDGP